MKNLDFHVLSALCGQEPCFQDSYSHPLASNHKGCEFLSLMKEELWALFFFSSLTL